MNEFPHVYRLLGEIIDKDRKIAPKIAKIGDIFSDCRLVKNCSLLYSVTSGNENEGSKSEKKFGKSIDENKLRKLHSVIKKSSSEICVYFSDLGDIASIDNEEQAEAFIDNFQRIYHKSIFNITPYKYWGKISFIIIEKKEDVCDKDIEHIIGCLRPFYESTRTGYKILGRFTNPVNFAFWSVINYPNYGEIPKFAVGGKYEFVYFIYENNNSTKVKIGRSKDPHRRLQQLQTGNPNKLYLFHVFATKCSADNEIMIHNCCNNSWIRGEWFNISQEILEFYIYKWRI